MAQEWWSKDQPAQQAGGGVFVPAPGAAEAEQRKGREEERDVTRLGISQAGEARSGREEVRGVAGNLRDAFEKQKVVTDYQVALPAYNTILKLASGKPNKASDFTIITLFNKVQDPGSAVLEGERTAAQDVSTLFEKYKAQLSGLFDPETGFVSDDARKQFVGSVQALITERNRAYNAMRDRYTKIAESPTYKANPFDVVGPHFGETFVPEIEQNWGKIFPPKKAEARGAVNLQVATGEKFATDRDIEIAQRASGIWSNRGISNDQAIQQLNELFQSYGLQPMAPEQANALRQDVERQTQWAPNPTGVRTGGDQETQAAIGAGLVSGATAGLGEEALSMIDEQAAQKLQAATEYARETSPVLTTGAEIVGGILSPLARVGPAGTIAGEATRGAVYGGLYGAGQAPVEAGLEERLPGAVIGALTGGAAGGAAQRILGRAATPGAPVPPAAAAPEVPSSPIMEAIAAPPTAREVIEAGERANIPVMTSDIRPPETFMGQQAQRIGERIPIVGTGGPRATQQAARQEAVKDFILETAGAVPADVEERIVTDVLRKRGDVVEKYTTLKGEVFSNLAGAGEVAVDKTLKAIDDQIAELSKARTPAADEAIAKLTEIRTQAAGRDIQAMEAFRRDVLGKAWQDESLSVGASDRVKAAVKSLYGPFNEDMGKFILDRSGKRDYTKWRVANARLSDGIQEANRNTLKSILRSGEATPEVINNMLFSAKKSDVAALYRSLTPEGKAQARMAIVQRIAKDIGADTGDISPEKFLTQVRKRSDQLGVFFEKGQQEELKGLVRALQATRRAGGANVATQTGQENFALLLGGLGIGDIFTTGGIGTALALTFSGAVRAYESKAVRNLMASLGKTKPGSEAERTILSKISEKVGQVAKPAPAVVAGQTSAQQAAPEQTPGAPIPQMPQ